MKKNQAVSSLAASSYNKLSGSHFQIQAYVPRTAPTPTLLPLQGCKQNGICLPVSAVEYKYLQRSEGPFPPSAGEEWSPCPAKSWHAAICKATAQRTPQELPTALYPTTSPNALGSLLHPGCSARQWEGGNKAAKGSNMG